MAASESASTECGAPYAYDCQRPHYCEDCAAFLPRGLCHDAYDCQHPHYCEDCCMIRGKAKYYSSAVPVAAAAPAAVITSASIATLFDQHKKMHLDCAIKDSEKNHSSSVPAYAPPGAICIACGKPARYECEGCNRVYYCCRSHMYMDCLQKVCNWCGDATTRKRCATGVEMRLVPIEKGASLPPGCLPQRKTVEASHRAQPGSQYVSPRLSATKPALHAR